MKKPTQLQRIDDALAFVKQERIRQERLRIERNWGNENDFFVLSTVLSEETGEVAKAILELNRAENRGEFKKRLIELEQESVQVAAVATLIAEMTAAQLEKAFGIVYDGWPDSDWLDLMTKKAMSEVKQVVNNGAANATRKIGLSVEGAKARLRIRERELRIQSKPKYSAIERYGEALLMAGKSAASVAAMMKNFHFNLDVVNRNVFN